MNQLLARLERAQDTQRRFVADASHELRSPLATMTSGLELLSGAVDPAEESTVRTLRGEAGRLDRLVDGLLLLARSDERGLMPRFEDVDLDEIVEDERGRPSDLDSGAGIDLEVWTVPVQVSADRAQLVRAVRNLVDNARRHARSRVQISLRVEQGYALVEVGDDGPGVPQAERERIFERFVRLDDARARADGGAGLGLAIVREIAAAHHGAVDVGDSPLGGALFRLVVPALPVDDDADPAAPGRPATMELKDDRPTGPMPVVGRWERPEPVSEQVTHSLPIRLGEATSPADVNATGPLPVVRPVARDQAGSIIR